MEEPEEDLDIYGLDPLPDEEEKVLLLFLT